MTKIVVVRNQKGGVTKTTSTFNLAAFFAAQGYRVLVIDLDPQGHIAISANQVNPSTKFPPEGVYQVLTRNANIEDFLMPAPRYLWGAVQISDTGMIDIFPGYELTQKTALELERIGSNRESLLEALAPIRDDYDLILIDTAPTNSVMEVIILTTADLAFIPTQVAALSYSSTLSTIQKLIDVRDTYDIRLMGIVPVLVKQRTKNYRQIIKQFRDDFGQHVWADEAISFATVWEQASNNYQTIFGYKPRSKAAREMWRLGVKFAKRLRIEVEETYVY